MKLTTLLDEETEPGHSHPENRGDLALYIHVPFCRQRCAYCHFDIKVTHPKTRLEPLVARYLAALEREMATYAAAHGHRCLGSVFIGGGTPSRLGLPGLSRILDSVQRHFSLCTDAEISVEANPEDLTPGDLKAWRSAGINRLSVGVQTFHDPSLEAVRRPHDGASAYAVLKTRPDFSKGCSLDLMLGLPYQTPATIQDDLQKVADLAMEHVSVYMLERDLPTPLDKLEGRLPLPSEDDQADAYETVGRRLVDLGFEHYEISNFAKPGFECRHNLVYWQCGDYLGLGPAAHGRVGLAYWANHPQLEAYCQAVGASGHGRQNQATWSRSRLRQERLIQGLRLARGLPANMFTAREHRCLARVLGEGLLELRGEAMTLTPKGRLLANEVFMCLLPDSP